MLVKECPKCGGKDIFFGVKTLINHIRCMDCGYVVMDNDRDAAIEKWNCTNNCDTGACDIHEKQE